MPGHLVGFLLFGSAMYVLRKQTPLLMSLSTLGVLIHWCPMIPNILFR